MNCPLTVLPISRSTVSTCVSRSSAGSPPRSSIPGWYRPQTVPQFLRRGAERGVNFLVGQAMDPTVPWMIRSAIGR